MKRPFKAFVPVIVMGLLLGCSRSGSNEAAVARVNGAPILLKDFKREVSLAALRDPSTKITPEALKDLLETSIDRRLMIDQAVKLGLSKDEKFLETIKTYWEQTLIKELVDAKTRELAEKITVTEEEIARHHEGMKARVTVRYVKDLSREKAEEARALLGSGGEAQGELRTEAILIEDVKFFDPIYNAFTMNEGAVGVFEDEDGLYSALLVIKKEAIKAPPLEAERERIRAMILEAKREQALDDWLDEIKKKSDIVIDDRTLSRVTDD